MKKRAAVLALALLVSASAVSAEDAFSAQNPLSQKGNASFASSSSPASAAENPSAIVGLWENSSRFIEFTRDGKMRVVLKPYYGFVYEDTGFLPCVGVTVGVDSVAADLSGPAPSSGSVVSPGAPAPVLAVPVTSSFVYDVSVRYTGEKYDQLVPLAVIGDGMYFRFFRRLDTGASLPSAMTAATAVPAAAASAAPPSSPAKTDVTAPGALDGFWLASGNADALRIYRSDEVEDFFSYYFAGSNYYRIRYWKTDALRRYISARFDGADGTAIEIPKFIPIGDALYTCITSTGTTLRNIEKGTWTLAAGKISFKPSNVVYAGTAAAVRNPVACTLSSDGAVLAFGAPYLVRSKIADLDAEIKTHNGLRRPPRKPVFDYMNLDFNWDEVNKVRNNGQDPAGN